MAILAIRRKHKKGQTRTQLSVDFPQQGERITSPQYTLRLSAPELAQGVDVSVDDGEWRPCRFSVGHWWLDWSGYDDGEHEVVARVLMPDGVAISSEPHQFFVRLETPPAR